MLSSGADDAGAANGSDRTNRDVARQMRVSSLLLPGRRHAECDRLPVLLRPDTPAKARSGASLRSRGGDPAYRRPEAEYGNTYDAGRAERLRRSATGMPSWSSAFTGETQSHLRRLRKTKSAAVLTAMSATHTQ
jgi:hypothetical protein